MKSEPIVRDVLTLVKADKSSPLSEEGKNVMIATLKRVLES